MRSPVKRFFSYLACSSLDSSWNARGVPSGKREGNFSDSSCCWIRWYSLRLAGTELAGKKDNCQSICRAGEFRYGKGALLSQVDGGDRHLLNSPLHCQVILRWQFAPGLLKSQAAQVASSTIADGWKECRDRLNWVWQKRSQEVLRPGK